MSICDPKSNIARQLINLPLSAITVKYTVVSRTRRGSCGIEADKAKCADADPFGGSLAVGCGNSPINFGFILILFYRLNSRLNAPKPVKLSMAAHSRCVSSMLVPTIAFDRGELFNFVCDPQLTFCVKRDLILWILGTIESSINSTKLLKTPGPMFTTSGRKEMFKILKALSDLTTLQRKSMDGIITSNYSVEETLVKRDSQLGEEN
uniref:Uncharacterized protein n=1 Tax=Glossina pallidipes TaxID=7398 RepID=A0A1B0A2L3_GLOPL